MTAYISTKREGQNMTKNKTGEDGQHFRIEIEEAEHTSTLYDRPEGG
jgi:hypothetical protein